MITFLKSENPWLFGVVGWVLEGRMIGALDQMEETELQSEGHGNHNVPLSLRYEKYRFSKLQLLIVTNYLDRTSKIQT